MKLWGVVAFGALAVLAVVVPEVGIPLILLATAAVGRK